MLAYLKNFFLTDSGCLLQGNRIKNFEKIQVVNFQMIVFWRLYSKIKNVLKTMVDNQVLTF